jgi:ABC-type transport system involved in multi-copper enzyme maturation permease subunit
MSISTPRYGAAPVARTGRVYRTLAIVRRELLRRSNLGTWLVVGLTYLAVTLILTFNTEFASLTGTLSLSTFETPYSSPAWPFLMLIVATSVGAGSLADDIGNRSITLYLSRPIRRFDYLAAKTAATGSWLVVAAVGPGLAGLAVVLTLGWAPTSLVLSGAAAFLATGLLASMFFTGLALALSSLTTRSLYAGVATFGVVLSLEIGAPLVSGLTGNNSVAYASPITDILSVAQSAFGSSGPFATDPLTSAAILAFGGGLLAIFAGWRISRVEVVGE